MLRTPTAQRPLILLLAALATGCGDSERQRDAGDEAPAAAGGTAVIVAAAPLDVPNPLVTGSAYMQDVNRHLLFTPLLRYDDQLQLAAYLAASWELEGDTAAILRLRQDSRWEDGPPVTAHDAAFTLRRALDPATGYPNAGAFRGWRDAVATDSFTLRVSFDPQRDPLGGLPLLPILPAHRLDSVPAQRLRTAAFNQAPVGNGPFRLVEQRAGDRWVFQANDSFPDAMGGRPRLDRIVWRTVPESQAQLAELRTGNAHLALEPPAARFDSLRRLPGLQGIEKPSLRYSFIGWNGRRPPLQNAGVRRALTLAIDRTSILQAFRGGHGRLASSPVPPGHWAHADLQPLPHDPERARRLLRQAGYGPDQPLELQLLIPAGSDANRDLAQLIQDDLARADVRLRIRPLDFSTLVQTITGPERDFDAVLLALDASLRLDLRSLFHSDALQGPFQLAGYTDARVDSLLDTLERTRTRDQARPHWIRLQEILNQDQPWTFLYYYPDLLLASDRLHGLDPDLRGLLRSAPAWSLTPDDH